jgi:hypothetical protein
VIVATSGSTCWWAFGPCGCQQATPKPLARWSLEAGLGWGKSCTPLKRSFVLAPHTSRGVGAVVGQALLARRKKKEGSRHGGRLPRRQQWRLWRDAGDGGQDAARHEAADAAAWPRWRRRSKPWKLGFWGGGAEVLGFVGEGRRRWIRGGCRKGGRSLEPAAADLGEPSAIGREEEERRKKKGCGWAVPHNYRMCAAHPCTAALSGVQDLPLVRPLVR